LAIDMLKDFLDSDGALCIGDTEEIIRNVSARIKEWRAGGNPIIYIMDRHLPQDAEFKMFPPIAWRENRAAKWWLNWPRKKVI